LTQVFFKLGLLFQSSETLIGLLAYLGLKLRLKNPSFYKNKSFTKGMIFPLWANFGQPWLSSSLR